LLSLAEKVATICLEKQLQSEPYALAKAKSSPLFFPNAVLSALERVDGWEWMDAWMDKAVCLLHPQRGCQSVQD